MKSWTVHLHDTRPPVLVREGFAWGAASAGPFWFMAHSAWMLGALVLASDALIAVFTEEETTIALLLVAHWCLGLWGHDLRRWALRLRGYRVVHVVAARDADGAFVRLLSVRPDLADLYMPAAQHPVGAA
ncbi:MAG: hypothetical protein EXR05_10305 [Acetobacteraceae bacterium]|nr:hypothetical protein [Acetobacteraceae bacterium]MSP30688.1 hypothetical protein [Acetobacteraceae bacterium]